MLFSFVDTVFLIPFQTFAAVSLTLPQAFETVSFIPLNTFFIPFQRFFAVSFTLSQCLKSRTPTAITAPIAITTRPIGDVTNVIIAPNTPVTTLSACVAAI